LVEAVRFGSRLDRPDELLVRGGVLGNRRLVIPVADVVEIDPRQRRLVLRGAPERGGHDHLGRLRGHVSRSARPAPAEEPTEPERIESS
jgi:hypothetical protein